MASSALSSDNGRTKAIGVVISSFTAIATAGALIVWLRWRDQKGNKRSIHRRLQCQCGSVKIQVDAANTTHLICYCDDCQSYEKYCKSGGGSRRISDRYGGIRICQVYKSDLIVLEGYSHLQCTALAPKKLSDPDRPFQMFRFHTDCCHTPMISAYWRELPVVGFPVANLVVDNDPPMDSPCDDDESDQICVSDYISQDPAQFDWNEEHLSCLPPVQYRVQTQHAKGEKLPIGALGFPNRFVLGFLWRNFVLGIGQNKASPFPLPEVGQERYRDMEKT